MIRKTAIPTAVCAAVILAATATVGVASVARAGAHAEKAAALTSSAAVTRDCHVTAAPATDPVTGASATQLVRTCS